MNTSRQAARYSTLFTSLEQNAKSDFAFCSSLAKIKKDPVKGLLTFHWGLALRRCHLRRCHDRSLLNGVHGLANDPLWPLVRIIKKFLDKPSICLGLSILGRGDEGLQGLLDIRICLSNPIQNLFEEGVGGSNRDRSF